MKVLIQLCDASMDDQVKVKCIGALECLAMHPTSIEANQVRFFDSIMVWLILKLFRSRSSRLTSSPSPPHPHPPHSPQNQSCRPLPRSSTFILTRTSHTTSTSDKEITYKRSRELSTACAVLCGVWTGRKRADVRYVRGERKFWKI